MDGWYSSFVAQSFMLELARFSVLLRIQDGAQVWQKQAVKLELISAKLSKLIDSEVGK